MKNQWISMWGVCVVIGLLLISCQSQEQQETTVEQTFGAAQVKVIKVIEQKISERLQYTGLIEAHKKIVLNPDVGGKIARIYVEEGDRVKKGQVLAELDTRAIQLQVEQAEAQLAVTEANYNDAKNNLERWERLRKENAVSEQQYEQIKLAHEAAESQRQQARAVVNLAKYNLDVSIMEAPFDGIIASKNAEVGDVVNPMMGGFGAASGVLTLMDFSKMKIDIEVSHNDVVRIVKGQAASLHVSVYPEKTFEGRVTVVNMAADPLSKKFGVEVQLSNPGLLLKPNTYGDVSLEITSHEDALVIPQQALLEDRFVILVQDDKAVYREVVIGLQNSTQLEVLKGLQPGDLVVVEGNYGLEEGADIEITEVIQ